MSASNPYESTATGTATASRAGSWFVLEYLVAGLWTLIPVGVFAGRHHALHIFGGFSVDVPTMTDVLLRLESSVLVTLTAAEVVATTFSLRDHRTRRLFSWVMFLTGLVVGVVFLVAIMGPLMKLIRDQS